jgi:hypothetical protein
MIDLGKKSDSPEMATAISSSSDKDEVRYPSLCISGIEGLPFKSDDAGKTFKITATVKVRRVSVNANKDGKSKDVDLDFVSIGDVNASDDSQDDEEPDTTIEDMKKAAAEKKSKKTFFEGE